MKPERGYSLIECLVYIAVLAVVLNLSFLAYYRYNQHSISLYRNANDIVFAVHAGERWREDIRASTAPPRATANGVVIPQRAGEVTYVLADGTVWRRTFNTQAAVLRHVKASTMSDDSRPRVNAWRWELEMASPGKNVLVRPLFSFTAVTGRQS